MSTLHISSLVLCLGIMTASCGDDGGSGGGDGDAGDQNPCGFEDRYLPYQVGYQWTYRVTDILTGDTTTKAQVVTAGSAGGLVQTTTKATGSTVSTLEISGDAVVRLQQEDFDQVGALERTTVYAPGQTRLDEAADQITVGAVRDDDYTATITQAVGGAQTMENRTDHWEVLGVDVECSSPLGTFRCLHLKRTRTVGGVSTKEFFYARGIGKVKEVNPNQLEELVACE
jgi:hypothetical protein